MLPRAILLLTIIAFAGCAGMNDDDGLDPTTNGLEGTWEYLVTNAYEAEFTGCSGDATVLEGATFFEGLSLAPICITGVTVAAIQDGDSFERWRRCSGEGTRSGHRIGTQRAVGERLGPGRERRADLQRSDRRQHDRVDRDSANLRWRLSGRL